VITLSWHGVDYEKSRFFVKGTILAQSIVPGTLSRFAVREVRGGIGDDGYSTLRYELADAATVSDADVRAGKLPRSVYWSDEPDDCVVEAMRIIGSE